MFPGIGTTLNIITIILGGAIGVFIGSRINQKLRDLILDALGCVTIISAADALMDFWNPAFQSAMPSGWALLVIVFSLILGAVFGTLMRIEERLENIGEKLKSRFTKSEGNNFVEGFVSASLIFAIGPLAILGSISVGIYQFAWTAVGLFLGSILADYQVLAMTSVGGILLIGISLRLLRIKTIEIGNLLPALAFAPILALFAHQFI
ncbi:MAG: DUF554 family protein [Actinobacteria bacterium]|nr:DUF554 family protein [Actinomycetota bacterium]